MKLPIYKRSSNKKSELNTLRREGKIPAVLYVRGKESEPLFLEQSTFLSTLRQIKEGHLPTSKFTLVTEEGKEIPVLVKDIQYKPTTYEIIHLDFEELLPDVKVRAKVPIECVGAIDCVGIKLGGVLRQVVRNLPIECLPGDLPECFELDVKELGLNESKKLKDLNLPSTVRPLADLRQVAVVIAKK